MKHPLLIVLFVTLLGLLVTLVPPPRPAIAHNGEDHGAAAKPTAPAGGAPDEVLLPKESQFLFDIRTELVQSRRLLTRAALLGQVAAAPGGEGRVVAPQAGRVVQLLVEVGQRVKAGQLLAVLDQTLAAPEQINLSTGQANAQAELRAAQQEYARLKSIEDIAARKDVIAAELRLRQARQNAGILANQGSARRVRLTAPVSGTVDVFALATGQQVSAGEELLRVINQEQLAVVAQVFADELPLVEGADQFLVEGLQGEGATPARLVSFSNVVNPANQARQLLLNLEKTTALRVGQQVRVLVQRSGDQTQLAVPASAITDINGQPAVFIHTAPEVFKLRFVQPGTGDERQTAVLAGLKERERVVTRNTYQLKSVYLNQ